jgi:hypothetical protein
VGRLDLFPHALDIPLFLLQNVVRILHGYLPGPRRTLDFVRSKENSSSGVEQALDPLFRFPFCGHEPGRPSQRYVHRRSDQKDDSLARARVLDLKVEIASFAREMSTSIQQYQIAARFVNLAASLPQYQFAGHTFSMKRALTSNARDDGSRSCIGPRALKARTTI